MIWPVSVMLACAHRYLIHTLLELLTSILQVIMLAGGNMPIKCADNSHPAAFSPSSLSLPCSPCPHKEGKVRAKELWNC